MAQSARWKEVGRVFFATATMIARALTHLHLLSSEKGRMREGILQSELVEKAAKKTEQSVRSCFRRNNLFFSNIEWKTTPADFYEALMHIIKSIYTQFCGLCGLQCKILLDFLLMH